MSTMTAAVQTPEQKIVELKAQIEKCVQLKYQHEARLKTLNENKDTLEAELIEVGIKPEELDQTITSLATEINTTLAEVAAAIPVDLLKGV